VGSPSHSTSRQGATRFASSSVTGLTLTLPSITFTGAPANAIAVAGVPTGVSGAVTLGELSETAQWTPAASSSSGSPAGTPGAGNPGTGGTLPDTGGRMLLPVVGLIVIGTALALRRRSNRSA